MNFLDNLEVAPDDLPPKTPTHRSLPPVSQLPPSAPDDEPHATAHQHPVPALRLGREDAMRCLFSLLLVAQASGYVPAGAVRGLAVRTKACDVQMLNLFGNTDESRTRRDSLSLRSAPAGSRKVTFRKPNTATKGLTLGLVFKEGMGKAVIIDRIIPGTEAARLERNGQIRPGDEITMVSATFGDEMWSSRGVGKYRLEKSIAVRQGMSISFVVESSSDSKKRNMQQFKKKRDAEAERMTRLQKQLAQEVEDDKKKGGLFGGLFN